MQQPLSIVIAGPPSRYLLPPSEGDSGLNPFVASFPLINQLAEAYCQMGNRVTFLTTSDRVSQPMECRGCHELLNIVCVPRRRTKLCMADLYRREVHQMALAIKARTPDVVHALWSYEYADAALRSGFPTLVTAHDSPWGVALQHKRALRIERAVYSQFWVLPRTKHLSTVSPYMAQALRRYHFYRRPIVVIPNGVPNTQFADKPRFMIRDKTAPVIVGVSEWYPLKNPEMILQAFKEVQKVIRGARLVLFGHGFETGGMAERYARQIGIVGGVDYFGYSPAEKVRAVLQSQADIFLHPTREESFGMTFLEAMSLGIPCVGGAKSGAVPWVLDEGRAGLLVDVEDSADVAGSLLRLIREAGVFERCAFAGYQHAQNKFNLENVADQYVALLREVRDSNG